MNNGVECTLRKLRVADSLEGHAAVQKDLERLCVWVDRNLMKSNSEKSEVFNLGRNNPIHQSVLGAAQLESSSAKKAQGDTVLKLDMSHQGSFCGVVHSFLGCMRK